MRSCAIAHFKALLVALSVSACAIVPAPVGSTAGRLEPGRAVMFFEQPSQPSSAEAAETAVRQLLLVQGYRIVAKSDLSIEVSFAKRDPGVGFSNSASGNTTTPVEGEQRTGRINLCRDNIYRLSVAITDQRSGVVAYRGFSEDVSCHLPVGNELSVLAAAAMRTLRPVDW